MASSAASGVDGLLPPRRLRGAASVASAVAAVAGGALGVLGARGPLGALGWATGSGAGTLFIASHGAPAGEYTPLGTLAVSLFLPDVTPATTFHWEGRQTASIIAGNHVAEKS